METVLRLYEGMFLVDSGAATVDWQSVLDEIQRVLDRAGAEVVSLKKWDDRRMAYEINRKSRGTYILTYFNCDTSKLSGIERDVQLSELLVRVLILRTDRMNEQDLAKLTPMEAATAASEAAVAAAAAAEAEAAESAPAEATEEVAPETPAEAPAGDEAEEKPAE